MQKSLLVMLAHPDDESFPMGGTLAKYAAAGVRVVLVCATLGEAGISGLSPQETARRREEELRAAAQTLGVSEVRLLGYRDGQLAQVDPDEAVARLVVILREVQPQAVITFGLDGISGHADHVAIHRFVTAAFDQARLPGRLFYLAPSEATQQGCGEASTQAVPGGPVASIDVGEHLATKVQAMQCHASQNPPYPGPPEEEATRLACHEYFTLARPLIRHQVALADLFEVVPSLQRDHQPVR